MKTLDDAPAAEPAVLTNTIVAFVHIEPRDLHQDSSAETKLIKNAKWLARKWKTLQSAWHPVASAPIKALKCLCLFGL